MKLKKVIKICKTQYNNIKSIYIDYGYIKTKVFDSMADDIYTIERAFELYNPKNKIRSCCYSDMFSYHYSDEIFEKFKIYIDISTFKRSDFKSIQFNNTLNDRRVNYAINNNLYELLNSKYWCIEYIDDTKKGNSISKKIIGLFKWIITSFIIAIPVMVIICILER